MEPSECVFFDNMHNLLASGGLAQYQVNAFVNTVVQETAITSADLNEFMSTVVLPRSYSKPPKTFFSSRIVGNERAHCKGFAGEMITIVSILVLFCESVLAPGHILDDHVTCMCLLGQILDWCVIAHESVLLRHCQTLNDILDRYSDLSSTLYPSIERPKLHYLQHTPGAVTKHGVNVTCFAPERRHKVTKSVVEHTFADHNTATHPIKKLVYLHIQGLKEPKTFMGAYLHRARSLGDLNGWTLG